MAEGLGRAWHMLSVERRTVDVVSLAGRAVSAVTAPPRRVTGRQPDRCARVGHGVCP